RLLIEGNAVAEFASAAEAKGYSSLAEKLFDFPFVSGVFIMSNFVTITKTEQVEWDLIVYELREFVRDFLMNNEKAVEKLPEIRKTEVVSEDPKVNSEPVVPSEFDDQIRQILEEYVRPAVENDGGLIDFKSFKDGIVTVTLRGSCSGCPSSLSTLKGGIETMLTQMIPEVKTVVAEEL
ncbi:MAG: NifU family protein, partial [Cryomorphaceae bacterium]